MNATTIDHEVEAAAGRMYDAEVALHIARQTGVDEWVNAAADRLHDAIVAYRCAIAGRTQAA